MAWISVHEDVVGSKLRKLSNEVGCSQAEALGILNVIWLWGLKNADQTGELKDANRRNVAAAIPFDMLSDDLDPRKIVDALVKTGWIDEVDGALFLHDWDEWQEQWYKFLDRKAYDAKRKREKRRLEKERANQLPKPDASPELPPETPHEPQTEVPPAAPPGEEKPKRQRKQTPKPEKTKFAEFVHMKDSEYQKLIDRYGKPAADKAIEILNNYKGSKGKRYADDYRAILNWVMDRVQEKHPGLIKRQDCTAQGTENPYEGWGSMNG